MILVGNDVVDLGDGETQGGAEHPRFDARVFAPAERALLREAADPTQLRWLLWAAKESTWKLLRKLTPHVMFSPVRFVVQPLDDGSLQVTHDGSRALVHVERAGGSLHAVARRSVDAQLPLELADLRAAPPRPFVRHAADASAQVRALALHALAPVLGCDPTLLRIGKHAGIPRVLHGSTLADVDLSLSHHGRFVAFAASLARARGPVRILHATAQLSQDARATPSQQPSPSAPRPPW